MGKAKPYGINFECNTPKGFYDIVLVCFKYRDTASTPIFSIAHFRHIADDPPRTHIISNPQHIISSWPNLILLSFLYSLMSKPPYPLLIE